MQLKDATAMHIPAAPPSNDAHRQQPDEFSHASRRYALRQPGRRSYVAAAVLSAFWLGAAIAFTIGFLGADGLAALPWPWLVGLIVAVLFPVILAWHAAQMARRAEGLRLASEDLLQVSARLIEPDATAGREISRLGRAVKREIDALNAGFDGALTRMRSLESAVAERLSGIEETVRKLDERGEAIRAALREERDTLASFAASLQSDAERMGETIKARGQSLRDLAREAANDVATAQGALDERAARLKAALDDASDAAIANAQNAERGAQAMIGAAEALDGRLESFVQRGERQRAALTDAITALKSETQALEQTMARNLEALGGLGQTLVEQTRRADAVAADISRRGEAAAGGLGARADAIAAAFQAHIERLDGSALEAEERLKATTSAASQAAEHVRTTFEMAARSVVVASEKTSESTTGALHAMTQALDALNAKAEETRQTASQTISELRAEAEALPVLIATRLKELSKDEPQAAEPAPEPVQPTPGARHGAPPIYPTEPVNKASVEPEPVRPVVHEPDLDTSFRPAGPMKTVSPAKPQPHEDRSQWFGFARRLAGLMKRDGGGENVRVTPNLNSDWRLSDALNNADEAVAYDDDHGPQAPGDQEPGSVDLHQEALHVVDKLQTLAIDLDRALGDDPAPDLWRRYTSGERSVFTRRLIAAIGREGAQRIAERYETDKDFQMHANRYMTEFEALLDDAAARDRDHLLIETFLTSQTGRLYLLIAAATGRL